MRSEGYSSCPCLYVRLLSQISPLERLFVMKMSHTQRAMEVKNLSRFL